MIRSKYAFCPLRCGDPSRSPSDLRKQWYEPTKRWTDADKLHALLEESGFRIVEKVLPNSPCLLARSTKN
jgi:hypothetical protein